MSVFSQLHPQNNGWHIHSRWSINGILCFNFRVDSIVIKKESGVKPGIHLFYIKSKCNKWREHNLNNADESACHP